MNDHVSNMNNKYFLHVSFILYIMILVYAQWAAEITKTKHNALPC